MFNRNHNYIVDMLLQTIECDKWTTGLDALSISRQETRNVTLTVLTALTAAPGHSAVLRILPEGVLVSRARVTMCDSGDKYPLLECSECAECTGVAGVL